MTMYTNCDDIIRFN